MLSVPLLYICIYIYFKFCTRILTVLFIMHSQSTHPARNIFIDMSFYSDDIGIVYRKFLFLYNDCACENRRRNYLLLRNMCGKIGYAKHSTTYE
jgi:hypothetical protein